MNLPFFYNLSFVSECWSASHRGGVTFHLLGAVDAKVHAHLFLGAFI